MGVFLAYRVNWLRQIYGFFYNIKNDFQKNLVCISTAVRLRSPREFRMSQKVCGKRKGPDFSEPRV
jgi:hypothetical protein